jgi:glycosyltransferase involved in cell wall biosynthesis
MSTDLSNVPDNVPPRKPRILVLIDHYLPGYRAGGPLRTISAMVNALGDEFTFLIITSDRDLGDDMPYSEVPTSNWTFVDGASVYYLSRDNRRTQAFCELLATTPHDLLYLNSLFSLTFSLTPILLARARLLGAKSVLLAPRGELGAGALHRSRKKRAFLSVARLLKLHRGIVWQGSTCQEVKEIQRHVPGAFAYVAPDLAEQPSLNQPGRRTKQKGSVRLLFLSRIVPKKNLHGALDLLREISCPVFLTVCGPIEDDRYWRECGALVAILPNNVQFAYAGEVSHSHTGPLLRNHDALFLPTLHENFGHVILESLSAGTPVLISDQTPWRDLPAKLAGWDLPLDNPDLIRAAIRELADMDEPIYRTWSAGASSAAHEWFASDKAVSQNRAILRLAITPQSNPRPPPA